jgi:hypothetical protein
MNGWTFEYVCSLPDSVRTAALMMLKSDQDAVQRNRHKK